MEPDEWRNVSLAYVPLPLGLGQDMHGSSFRSRAFQ